MDLNQYQMSPVMATNPLDITDLKNYKSLFLILSRFLHVFSNGYQLYPKRKKKHCRMVIPQVLDENQSLFLILTRFLHVSAMVTNNNRNTKNPM